MKSVAVTTFCTMLVAFVSEAQSDEAAQVLDDIREIARETNPDMAVLNEKISRWLSLHAQRTALDPARQQAHIEAVQRSMEALKHRLGSSNDANEHVTDAPPIPIWHEPISGEALNPLREALAPLDARRMEEVEIWFSSEKTKECVRHFMNNPGRDWEGRNPLSSPLFTERLLDWRSGENRQNSQFACAFLRRAMQTVVHVFGWLDLQRFPELAQSFGWTKAPHINMDMGEWLIYDNASRAVNLNVVDGRIVISGLMAKALVDIAVEGSFGSFDAMEKLRAEIEDTTPLESIVQSGNRLSPEQLMERIFGDSQQELMQKMMRGEPITVERDPFVLLGGEKQAEAGKFDQVFSQLFAFVLLHELGHIALGHDHENSPTCALTHEMEYEADGFAASTLARMSGGVAGINWKREIDGLKTFYRRFADFGFVHDGDCAYPTIEDRFDKIQIVYRSTRDENDDQRLRQLQQKVTPSAICARLPAATQAACRARLKKQGVLQ